MSVEARFRHNPIQINQDAEFITEERSHHNYLVVTTKTRVFTGGRSFNLSQGKTNTRIFLIAVWGEEAAAGRSHEMKGLYVDKSESCLVLSKRLYSVLRRSVIWFRLQLQILIPAAVI